MINHKYFSKTDLIVEVAHPSVISEYAAQFLKHSDIMVSITLQIEMCLSLLERQVNNFSNKY